MFARLPRIPRLFRQTIGAASLVGFLAAVIGIPIWNPYCGPNGKDLTKPFPCQHRVCGCQNAESCWRGCCCFSNQEKLAWAKKAGVTPPGYVAANARSDARAAAVARDCPSQHGCCHAKPVAAAPQPHVRWVVSLAARQCSGLGQLWLILSAAMPAPPRVGGTADHCETAAGGVPDASLLGINRVPATPPPRA
jgi:hypothetical protein